MLVLILAGAIAIHQFQPDHWPALAIDILHSLHGTGFAILAILVYLVLRWQFPGRRNYLAAGLVTFVFGLISEAAQIPGPRDAQLKDLFVDSLGIFGAIGLLAAINAGVSRDLRPALRVSLFATALIALSVACLPTLWLSYAMFRQQLDFPQVLTFESLWERSTFGQTASSRPSVVDAPEDWPVDGEHVAWSEESGRWGIFISIKPAPDWRGYSSLTFWAASTNHPFTLGIGLRDMDGSRFYTAEPIGLVPRRVTIELPSKLNLSAIESITLSADSPGSGATLLVDDFQLE